MSNYTKAIKQFNAFRKNSMGEGEILAEEKIKQEQARPRLRPSTYQNKLDDEKKKQTITQFTANAMQAKQGKESENQDPTIPTDEDIHNYEKYIRYLEPQLEDLINTKNFTIFLKKNGYLSMAQLYENLLDTASHKHSHAIEAIRIQLLAEIQKNPLVVQHKIKKERDRATAKKKDIAKLMRQLNEDAERKKQEKENNNSIAKLIEDITIATENDLSQTAPEIQNLNDPKAFEAFLKEHHLYRILNIYSNHSSENKPYIDAIDSIRNKLFEEIQRKNHETQPKEIQFEKTIEGENKICVHSQQMTAVTSMVELSETLSLTLIKACITNIKENKKLEDGLPANALKRSKVKFPLSVLKNCYFGIINGPQAAEQDINHFDSHRFFASNYETYQPLHAYKDHTIYIEDPSLILTNERTHSSNINRTALEEFSQGVSAILSFLQNTQPHDAEILKLQNVLLRYPTLIQKKLSDLKISDLKTLEEVTVQVEKLEQYLSSMPSLSNKEIQKILVSIKGPNSLLSKVKNIIINTANGLSSQKQVNVKMLLERIQALVQKAEKMLGEIKIESFIDQKEPIEEAKQDVAITLNLQNFDVSQPASSSTRKYDQLKIERPEEIIGPHELDRDFKRARIMSEEEKQQKEKQYQDKEKQAVAKKQKIQKFVIILLIFVGFATLITSCILFPPLGIIASFSFAPTLSTIFAAVGATLNIAFLVVKKWATTWLTALQEAWQKFCSKHPKWSLALSVIGMILAAVIGVFGAASLLSFTTTASLFNMLNAVNTAIVGAGCISGGIALFVGSKDGFEASIKENKTVHTTQNITAQHLSINSTNTLPVETIVAIKPSDNGIRLGLNHASSFPAPHSTTLPNLTNDHYKF